MERNLVEDKKNAWHNVRGVSRQELAGDPRVQEKYGHFLHTSWDGVRQHPHQDMGIRAAQFSPFAALTGYDDEIENTSKVRVFQDDLSEEEKEKLDYNLNALFQMIQERPEVSVTFFQQELEDGRGNYTELVGRLKKIDPVFRKLIFENGQEISVDDIRKLSMNEEDK